MDDRGPIDEARTAMLVQLQRESFAYFDDCRNPKNGLIADSTAKGSPCSIAAVGFALSAYAVGVERGLLSRRDAIERTLTTLRFFDASAQNDGPKATGYKGFYYHFLDMTTGERAWESELSTIDTALLMAGVLTAGSYFDGDDDDERAIRDLAESLYLRVDWQWATNGRTTLCHGHTPEHGFLSSYWDQGYSEAIILYVLAMGSPTFPVAPDGYLAWTDTFERITAYDVDYVYAGPLFIHQFSHLWLDLRGIHDACNERVGFDYFENSRRATVVHRKYAIDNPHGFARYSKDAWGLTASDGPGPAVRKVRGVRREFFGYLARGAPFGPDDGTFSPWAVMASLPFAPDIVCEAAEHAIRDLALKHPEGGFEASFNPTFPERGRHPLGWVAPNQLGINDGPIVLAVENHFSGRLWDLVRKSPHVVRGLRRAGFTGGWLG